MEFNTKSANSRVELVRGTDQLKIKFMKTRTEVHYRIPKKTISFLIVLLILLITVLLLPFVIKYLPVFLLSLEHKLFSRDRGIIMGLLSYCLIFFIVGCILSIPSYLEPHIRYLLMIECADNPVDKIYRLFPYTKQSSYFYCDKLIEINQSMNRSGSFQYQIGKPEGELFVMSNYYQVKKSRIAIEKTRLSIYADQDMVCRISDGLSSDEISWLGQELSNFLHIESNSQM
jgi:hypothetical protein